ncbi:GerAB/ArcD/ProY family transporter [Bacillus sp. T3]|uniref:GerAB/ArcD/ProY family transporter n=1 Tax=Bacillus sp. T3 TaxID=467262 RepID=UPI002982207C|nr:GerAB/ArcD/ProY family transporter [Bacillus sp. T3]
MIQVKITPFQLFCLMFLFELGSSIVVGLGLDAKQDAWLTILLGMVCAIPLFSIYSYLYQQYPDLPLTSYLPKILGKVIGIPIALAYSLYFLYISTRVLRDFGDLMITSTLDVTPLYAVNGLMILLIIYGIYSGLEVIGRTSEIIFFTMLFLVFSGILVTILSGLMDFSNLSPVLEGGWKPIISTVFRQTYTFPFGEMIVFTMLLPHLTKPDFVNKVGVLAIISSGLILCFTIVMEISILGVEGTAAAQFPLLETVSKVSFGDFIQRLDAIVVATLILGMFMKIIIFFYAGLTEILDVFNISKKRHKNYFLLLIGFSILIYSQKIAGNFAEHIKIGLKLVPVYLHLPLQTGIPLFLFFITLIRTAFRKNKAETM